MNKAQRLDRQHQLAQQALHARIAAMLRAALEALPDYDQPALETYGTVAARTVDAGQTRSARLAAAYLLARAGARRTDVRLEGALAAVLVGTSSPVAVAPVLRIRRLLADGLERAAAVSDAGGYASGLASTDLHTAQRVGLDQAQAAARVTIRGYRKVTGASPCRWCLEVAGSTYSRADRVPFHMNDNCSVAVVLEGEH